VLDRPVRQHAAKSCRRLEQEVARALPNEDYEFPPVVPGEYRLTVRRGDARLWEVPVVVREGEATTVDLGTPAEATPRDDHPRDS